VDDYRWQVYTEKQQAVEAQLEAINSVVIHPNTEAAEQINPYLEKPLSKEYHMKELLKRPELTYDKLKFMLERPTEDNKVAEQVDVRIKYDGYIRRQQDEIDKHQRHEQTKLPDDFDYQSVKGLSTEVMTKLEKTRPATIGQASRISGITPAAISLLLVYLKKRQHVRKSA
jgi:tRNA uridine 5-carboxymethylaminomethyl modification enzyme